MSNKVRRTYQQSLFNDPQLALPEHDNIVRWVDQLAKNSTDKLLNAIGYDCEHSADGKAYLWSKQRNREEFFDIVSKALQKIAHNKNAVLPKPPPVKVLSVIWEPILKNERGTTVGAMDLIITLGLPIPVLHYEI